MPTKAFALTTILGLLAFPLMANGAASQEQSVTEADYITREDAIASLERITQEEYEQIARKKGFNKKCLRLTDKARGFLHAMTMSSRGNSTAGTGFSIEICTPANWIARQFYEAKKEYRPLTWDDLTEEDAMSGVVRVFAYPDKTTNLNLENGQDVAHVVLRHPDKKKRNTVILQPRDLQLVGVDDINSLGGERQYIGVVAYFSMADMEKVRDKKGEFLVTIVGEGEGEKNFKVKRKHLDDLGLR